MLSTISPGIIVDHQLLHGYFLSLLFDPRTNRRTDDYRPNGEWMEAFFREIRRLTVGRLLSIRLSAFVGLSDRARELVSTTQVAKLLDAIGVDIIDLSAGYYTGPPGSSWST
jgi:2,4-dienoyl-CoA reductase-like NADH-dependent reductase (Old Yellow Enzyme family)